MSDSPIPPFIKPPAYYNTGTVDAEAPYNIAAAFRTAATYRSLMLSAQVYGHPDYTLVYFIDVQNFVQIAGGRVIIPPNALYLNYQVIFLVADHGSPATVNHQAQVWDGGSETTGWVETGMVGVKQSALAEAWFLARNSQEDVDILKRHKNTISKYYGNKEVWYSGPIEKHPFERVDTLGNVLYSRKFRRLLERNLNYDLPATNGASLFEWPTNRITGRVPLTNANLVGTNTPVYWELQVKGTDNTSNYELYKPLFVSAWLTCGDSL